MLGVMRPLSLIALSLLLSLGCSGGGDKGKPAVHEKDAAEQDMKRLQGDWIAIKFDNPGRTSDGPPAGLVFEFRGDRFTMRIKGEDRGEDEMTYRLDPSKDPKWIDLERGEGGGGAEGIYKIEDDELTLCLSFRNRRKGEKNEKGRVEDPPPRPTAFKRTVDMQGLWVLKPADAEGKSSSIEPAPPASPENNLRAKQLFEAMEGRLLKAKSVRCGFSTEFSFQGNATTAGAGGGPPTEGTLIFTEGNKVNLQIEEATDPDINPGKIVSDGVRLRENVWNPGPSKGGGPPPPKTREGKPNPQLTEVLRSLLCRVGLYHRFVERRLTDPGLDLPETLRFKPDTAFAVSDFTLGGKEKVGGRECQVVLHRLAPRGLDLGDRPVQVKVWIDVRTNLPLKRELIAGEGALRVTETYADMELDGKLEPKLFELPK
jgi:uncharacterized protein (TIGR03067 family)